MTLVGSGFKDYLKHYSTIYKFATKHAEVIRVNLLIRGEWVIGEVYIDYYI